MTNKIQRYLAKTEKTIRTPRVQQVLLVLSIVLFLMVGIFAGVKASNLYDTNSDAIIYGYLFDSGGIGSGKIVLPGQHANILKIPIFAMQGLLPYNYRTFTLASLSLTLLTLALWAVLLIHLFGKKYRLLIINSLSLLTLASIQFSIGLAETTIRNIEFPIALLFIMAINYFLNHGWPKRRTYSVGFIILFVLYALTVAGDSYFIFATTLPILSVLAWYWIQSRKFSGTMLKAGLIVLGVTVAGLVFKTLLDIAGIVTINEAATFAKTVIKAEDFLPSVGVIILQTMDLQGALVFGKDLGIESLASFISFGILLVSLFGVGAMACAANKKFRKGGSLTSDNSFIYASIVLSLVFTVLVYLFSGQVVQRLADGTAVSMGQIRYLAFVPFLLLIAFVWVIKTYYADHALFIGAIVCVMVIGTLSTITATRTAYNLGHAAIQPNRATLEEIESYLDAESIDTVVTGYWYGSPLRFWSENTINFAPIIDCKTPFGFNVRKDWYSATGEARTALIVDRTSSDQNFWHCSDEDITATYGTPVEKQQIGPVNVWVYDYDARTKLSPFPN